MLNYFGDLDFQRKLQMALSTFKERNSPKLYQTALDWFSLKM